jgi:predicted RNase H-like nuclease
MPKIEEVDGLLRRSPALLNRVFEIHPEVSFTYCEQRVSNVASEVLTGWAQGTRNTHR